MPANVATVLSIAAPTAPAVPPLRPTADDGSDFTDHLDRAQKAATPPPPPAKAQAVEKKTGKSAVTAKDGKKAKSEAVDGEAESTGDATEHAKVDGAGDALAQDSGGSGQPQGKPKEAVTEHPVKAEADGVNPAAVLALSSGQVPAAASVVGKPVAVKTGGMAAVNATVVESSTNTSSDVKPEVDANAKAQQAVAAFDATTAKPQAAGHERVAIVSPLDDSGGAEAKATAVVKPSTGAPTPALPDTAAPDAAGAVSVDAIAVGVLDKSVATTGPGSAQEGLLAQGATATPPPNPGHAQAAQAQPAPIPPEVRFMEANHAAIVSSVQTNLLPHGGSMLIRLDPPELGALQVSVEMRNGTMNATFQTSNEAATQLLSHSLGQLKTALESQGVTVEKIQVRQAPREQSSQNQGESSPQQRQDEAAARQDQQRKQMLRQMWRKVSGVADPVDMVA